MHKVLINLKKIDSGSLFLQEVANKLKINLLFKIFSLEMKNFLL